MYFKSQNYTREQCPDIDDNAATTNNNNNKNDKQFMITLAHFKYCQMSQNASTDGYGDSIL